jgi:transposase
METNNSASTNAVSKRCPVCGKKMVLDEAGENWVCPIDGMTIPV